MISIKKFLFNWKLKNESISTNVVSLKFFDTEFDEHLSETEIEILILAIENYNHIISEIIDLKDKYILKLFYRISFFHYFFQ